MIVQFDSVYKKFDDIAVLDNIKFKIKKNEIVCIIGPSGCGKSTILNMIAGLLANDKGIIDVQSTKIGFVFQEDRLLPWKTVYQNIKFVNEDTSDDEVHKMIDDLGLKGFSGFYPSELSGGMKQRCSIARAFNYRSDLLLMDEPFKSLDYSLRIKTLKQFISAWEKKKISVCFVTHEIDEALLLGDKIIILSNRPATVVKEFIIKKKKSERKLNDNELVKIRNQIIDLLLPAEANKRDNNET